VYQYCLFNVKKTIFCSACVIVSLMESSLAKGFRLEGNFLAAIKGGAPHLSFLWNC